MSLETLLEDKKCFKLICGAGNENLKEIESLVALYSKAGCHFFDLAANKEVIKAAQKGLDFSIPKEKQKDYHFCISIGTKGDQHVQKAMINVQKCTSCGKCIEICPQKAIEVKSKKEEIKCKLGFLSKQLQVVEKKCIGCTKCQIICEFNAIKVKSNENYFSLFPFPFSISCIELHASDTDEAEVDEIWDYLNKNFDGMLSLCIGRQKLSDEKILSRIKRLVAQRKPYTTIIQTDGIPMSGIDDEYKTTLPAVEIGKFVQSLNLPVYILLSGGTNSKTAELARIQGVKINGVAMGSYARKIIKEYIEQKDFLNSKYFDKAVKTAKNLIKSSY